MSFESLKIGKYTIKHPIVQGGMGLGISWDRLSGNVSLEGGLGVLSSVGTGYYKECKYSDKNVDSRPQSSENFYSKKALKALIDNTKKI